MVELRGAWATTLHGVLERGRRRATQPRVFGIPIAGRETIAPERARGCAACGRTPRPDESPDDDWRVGTDGAGELHVLCPECRQRNVDRSGAIGSR